MSQNYVANYSFNLGDYVETKEGKKGYIKTIVNSEYPEFQYINIDFGEKGMSMYSFYIYSDAERLSRSFNRIGQYDFTKKDEGKVEPLSDNYTESFPIFKTQDSVTGKTYKQECYSIDIGVISKKINEIVDAVNRLEEKVNGN